MSAFDNIIQEKVDFLSQKLIDISKKDENILKKPTTESQFIEIVDLSWLQTLDEKFSNESTDLMLSLILSRILSDILLTTNETEEHTEIMSTTGKIAACSALLDFIFHSRHNRRIPEDWKATYFKLFSETLDSLSWPTNIANFFEYPESRIGWFKMSTDESDVYCGNSSLISYKNPLSEYLRHWNALLTAIERNTTFNTPAHYKMKFRLQRFMSNLLPINEESNFNRSAQISQKQDSSNPWNRVKLLSRPTTRPELLLDDYLFLFNKLLTNPISFVFNTFATQKDAERCISSLLDVVLDKEDTFYREVKFNHRNTVIINDKLNDNYNPNYTILSEAEPIYLRDSKQFQKSENELWSTVSQFYEKCDQFPRPTLPALSTKNAELFYDQIMRIENDLYRKQFILQILFVSQLLERLIESEELRKFYKMNNEKEGNTMNMNVNDLENGCLKKLSSFYNHYCKNRIPGFYHSRDAKFTDAMKQLVKDDNNYMLAKLNNFKYFQNFTTEGKFTELKVDKNFKKFGFIKLGNKSIDNVWKIPTGFDNIAEQTSNVEEIYQKLKDEKDDVDMNNDENNNSKSVSQWQALRSIRSEYLTEFGKYNEVSGIQGLFNEKDDATIEKRRKNLRTKFESMADAPYKEQLKKAREFMTKRSELKRKLEEEKTNESNKKQEIDNKSDNAMDIPSVEKTEATSTAPDNIDDAETVKP